MMEIELKFDDSFYKKIGSSTGTSYADLADKVIDRILPEAENNTRSEAPILTGNLRRSISRSKPKKGIGEIRSSLKNPAYWVYVQYGTSKMAANPFVTRAARTVSQDISEYVKEVLQSMGISD